MSLLREAEKCLASQKTYASLSAFITPLQRSGPWLERVKGADARRERGMGEADPIESSLLIFQCANELGYG